MTPDVAELAAANDLGRHCRSFKAPSSVRSIVASAALTFFVGGLCAAVGVLALTDPRFAMPSETAWLLFLPAVVGIAITVYFGATSATFSAKARARMVHQFEHGFVQVTKTGARVCRWDQVQTIFQEIIQREEAKQTISFRFRLTMSDRTEILLTERNADMLNFSDVVTENVALAQLPKALKHLATGESITFGRMTMTAGGIAGVGKPQIPWADVAGTELLAGSFRLHTKENRRAAIDMPIAEIPNFGVMLALIHEYVRYYEDSTSKSPFK